MKTDSVESRQYSIRAVDRVCDILDIVRSQREGLSLSQISYAADLPKSSVFRYLSILEERNYLQRNPETSFYELGFAFQSQASMVLVQLKHITEPLLRRLRDKLHVTTNLGIFDNGQIVHALVVESQENLRLAAREGERGLIHSTAMGKAIAAHLDQRTVHNILLMHGMPQYTPRTIINEADYFAQLADVRAKGYGVDDSENQIGGRCIAVTVPLISIRAMVSISAPAIQIQESQIPALAQELQAIAREIATLMAETPEVEAS